MSAAILSTKEPAGAGGLDPEMNRLRADSPNIKTIIEAVSYIEERRVGGLSSADLIKQLDLPFARFFYVTDRRSGATIGYLLFHLAAEAAEIIAFAVSPAYRGRGVAKFLLRKTLDHLLVDEGITTVTLEVRPTNQPALKVYRRAGFKQVGIRKCYYSDNAEDAWVLRLDQ